METGKNGQKRQILCTKNVEPSKNEIEFSLFEISNENGSVIQHQVKKSSPRSSVSLTKVSQGKFLSDSSSMLKSWHERLKSSKNVTFAVELFRRKFFSIFLLICVVYCVFQIFLIKNELNRLRLKFDFDNDDKKTITTNENDSFNTKVSVQNKVQNSINIYVDKKKLNI
jgi:hypothetical protein